MSDASLIVFISQGSVITLLAGWLFLHEIRCAKRWADFMRDFGKLQGRVDQWHEDHSKGES